jgi:FemAB-related protein (PEP-CTERM system-associated)
VIELSQLQHGEEKVWDEYISQCPQASHCHLSGWRRVIERGYGHQSRYLWARENGEVRGVLPLVSMRSFLVRRSLVSLPFLDDGGICADNEQVRSRLYHGTVRLYEHQKADFLDLRHRYANNLSLPINGNKVMMILDLLANPDELWKHFDAKLRNQVRKAQKSGLTAFWSGKEGLTDFYEVFTANMRDLGSPVHSRKFFTAIFDEFPDSAKFMLVHKDDRVIGGAVCFFFRGNLIVPWASSLREYFSLCPNNLLYWEMIRWGCENGYQRFDFGRSSPDSGTYRFKKQWGAKEEPLHWQCLSRRVGHAVMPHANDAKYQWLIRTWSRLPLALTKFAGPLLRGQISS